MLLAPIAIAQAEPSRDWFNEATHWNTPGTSIPTAPSPDGGTNLADCTIGNRTAALPEDAQVEAAGWTLTGSAQIYGATTVITGMTNADGMCRPLGYQVFVFTNGEFSGTLSPIPMDSRTDGSLSAYHLYREGYIDATFSRYTPEDPLCCPSQQSRVFYEIEMQNDRPVLVPQLPADTAASQ